MRVFFGLSVPDPVSLELISVRDKVVTQLASASPKPVIAANFHMTLVFLGEITDVRKDELCGQVDQRLVRQLRRIDLHLDRARCFPDASGRIFAAEAPLVASLANLHQRLIDLSASSGSHPLRPHITLARLSRAYVPAPAMPLNLSFQPTELCLYESRLSEWGVRYRAIRRWPLPVAG